jgi:hypothetical protein
MVLMCGEKEDKTITTLMKWREKRLEQSNLKPCQHKKRKLITNQMDELENQISQSLYRLIIKNGAETCPFIFTREQELNNVCEELNGNNTNLQIERKEFCPLTPALLTEFEIQDFNPSFQQILEKFNPLQTPTHIKHSDFLKSTLQSDKSTPQSDRSTLQSDKYIPTHFHTNSGGSNEYSPR